MKRKLVSAVVAALFAVALPAFAGSILQEGTYRGSGTWEAKDGTGGTYTTEATVTGATLRSRWAFTANGRAQERTFTMTLVTAPEGAVQVHDAAGRTIGTARCLAGECLVTVTDGPVSLVQVVRTKDGRMECFGTKVGPGFDIVYAETLVAQ